MAKTRKMRRNTKRMHRMRGRGMMNTLRQKLTPSNQTRETLRQATFAITPSQAKLNTLKAARNKTLQGAKNVGGLAYYGAKGIGKGAWSAAKGVGSMAKNVVTSPIFIASQLATGSF